MDNKIKPYITMCKTIILAIAADYVYTKRSRQAKRRKQNPKKNVKKEKILNDVDTIEKILELT